MKTRPDVAKESGRMGCNIYEKNQRLWPFGRGKPSLGVLSVSETEEQRMSMMYKTARHCDTTKTDSDWT